jgi:hypothetical protein
LPSGRQNYFFAFASLNKPTQISGLMRARWLAGALRSPLREPAARANRPMDGTVLWEGAMLQSIMIVLVLAFSIAAVVGHVALLQAIVARRGSR